MPLIFQQFGSTTATQHCMTCMQAAAGTCKLQFAYCTQPANDMHSMLPVRRVYAISRYCVCMRAYVYQYQYTMELVRVCILVYISIY